MAPFFLILISYGSSTKLPLRMPGSLGALLLGAVLCGVAVTYRAVFGLEPYHNPVSTNPGDDDSISSSGWAHFPCFALDVMWEGLTSGRGWKYMSVIIPVTVVNISSNLAQVESAHEVGDRFSPGSSMAADAFSTLIGAALGSPYPTGIYIGQPAFKAMGAGSGFQVGRLSKDYS